MMRKTVLFLAVFMTALSLCAHAEPLSDEQTSDLITSEVLPALAIEGDYIAFLHPSTLTEEDELSPYAPTPIPDSVQHLPHLVPYNVESEAWFVWIDLQPYARYAHDTLFVLIDANTGSYAIHEEQWWPVLNGGSLWIEESDYWDKKNWISHALSGQIPTGTSTAPCEPLRPGSDFFDWALVINGWSPGQPHRDGLADDVAGMCSGLNRLGMRVSTLLSGEASPETLEAFVAHLFTDLPFYSCCDRLYFYVAAHASPGALWIGGQRLSSTELARMLTFPGNTYVPSRVYVLLETGYGGSFLTDLRPHGNINRVWTASAADEPAYGDVDLRLEPNPKDVGGEWTSSLLAALDQLLLVDDLAILAREFSREYIPLTMACLDSAAFNTAFLNGLSHPSSYLFSDGDPTGLAENVRYMAHWARTHHQNSGILEQRIAAYADSPCEEFFWILDKMARHDALLPPSPEFDLHDGKSAARDLSHSDWWEYCDLFWEIFSSPAD